MNSNQEKIIALLTNLPDRGDNKIEPATQQQIDIFTQRALSNGLESSATKQLVEFYEVANAYSYEMIIQFHSCDDSILFEWWRDKELWLGQRDFYTIRWANGKFCMGNASNISFSKEEEFETLVEFLEYYVAYINNLIQDDDEDGEDESPSSNM